MSEKARGTTLESGSLALRISWGFWWRKLVDFICLDIALVMCVVTALLFSYNRSLPEGTFVDAFRPAATTQVGIEVPGMLNAHQVDLRTATYVVSTGSRTLRFPLGQDVWAVWPVGLAVLVVQGINLLGIVGDMRRVRRSLKPLNDLALRAESLGSADLTSFDKIESLEQAIERANVDAPEVSTGDSDLASIEVALNRLLRQMQEAKLQQMRFVNDASHELRTPIAVIQGYVGMLDRWGKTDPAVLEESIEALRSESEHMKELVDQLLFLARGDSGRNALNKVPVNLAGLIIEVWEESSMIDAGHDYRLAFDEALGTDARLNVMGDVAMLKQLARIICQNAAKYSPEGSTITFDAGTSEGGTFFSVTDEGIGMSPDAASHAFERFYRADNARDAGAEGSGLGLSIAKWIADSHAGTIGVVSREGVGTRVTVTLPAIR